MLRALAASDDRRLREAATRTLLTSTTIRAQREVLGSLRAAVPGTAPGRKFRSIHDAHNKALSQFELPGELEREEGKPASGDDATDQAYDGLGNTYDMYEQVFARNSIDDRGMRLVATVHFGNAFNNAFWNGQQMVFGDGDGTIFTGFTKSLDVIGHELTHGVTEHTASLAYHNQSGALNESMSDVFGSLVKQYTRKQDAESADWLIGADILAAGVQGEALRSMKAPGTAYDDARLGGKDPQPKHMRDFEELPDDEWNDWGGVHIYSGIPNHAFYLAATKIAGNAWEAAGSIWYSALLQLWPTAEFQDCANVTIEVAGTLYGHGSSQQQAVQSAWDEVGVRMVPVRAKVRRVGRDGGVAVERNGARLRRQLETLSSELRKTIDALA
ncbi:MAG: M4 family metallopeptidase [Gemmatimonadaceae bacterium]